jgi:hypothetical protein
VRVLNNGVQTIGRQKYAPSTQRRFPKHAKPGNPMVLPDDHPAVVEGRSIFERSANRNDTGTALKPGLYQRKIGKTIVKGKWRGFPIFTLTLEERATCPRSCAEWKNCYGNRSPWSVRQKHGVELMFRLIDELSDLQKKYPKGFCIRLHQLGDFYSVDYVSFWAECLKTFPALHVFGYTARADDDEIGQALRHLIGFNWDRFSVRSSGGVLSGIPKAIVVESPEEAGDKIVCPAMQHKYGKKPDDIFCASCALCWSTKKTIVFLKH